MNLNQVTVPAVDVGHGVSTLSIEQVSEATAGHGPVVYFECEDLDQTVHRLRAKGVEFDSLPLDQPWLWREARLRDPGGNTLCLYWAGRNRRYPPWRLAGESRE